MPNLNILVPDEQHYELKVAAAVSRLTVKDFVLHAIREKARRDEREPQREEAVAS